MKLRAIFITIGVLGILSVGIVIGATTGSAAPDLAPQLAQVGTAFTYQGFITDTGSPANVPHDFLFKLFNDEGAGTQVGSTVTKNAVPVVDGYFTVELDFGDEFDGTALWLAIEVQGPGDLDYTTLSPRQLLTPVPYAAFAFVAPWAGLSGVPAEFADDTDNIDDTVSWGEVVGIVGNSSQQLAEGDHTHLKKTTTDLNVDANGDIKITDDPFSPDTNAYMGRVTKLFLKDLPDLLEELGGSGITLAQVNQNVKILWLTVETYDEPQRMTFAGYRWARVTGDPAGTDENDIYWPVRVDEYNNGSTEDTSATYKLFMVNGFLY